MSFKLLAYPKNTIAYFCILSSTLLDSWRKLSKLTGLSLFFKKNKAGNYTNIDLILLMKFHTKIVQR